MTLLSAVRWLELAAFVAIAVVAVVQWRRRTGVAAGWLALTFGVVAIVATVGQFVPPTSGGWGVELARKALVGLLVCFPYCLYRFASAFRPRSRRTDLLAAGATGAILLATAAMPRLGEQDGQEVGPWVAVYVGLFALQWTVLSLITVVRLWRAGRDQPTVARLRMRTLGSGAALVNVAILISAMSPGARTGTGVVVGQGVTLVATALFAAGFAPPQFLRVIWRRRDVAAFRSAEADLMGAETAERIAAIVLPHAADLVGGRAAVLVAADGAPRAWHGMDEERARSLAQRLPLASTAAQVDIGDLVAVRLRDGWLAVTTTTSTPFLGSGELTMVKSLAHFAGLALERAELFDQERLGRLALAAQAGQLAEAQRTAQLGSYTYDVATGRSIWSEEMGRIFGFSPDDVDDLTEAHERRVHPEDLDRLRREQRAAVDGPGTGPTSHEYRIIRPDGEVRWLHSCSRPLRIDGALVSWSGTVQDITDRKAADEAVAFQASHDALTGLPNRGRFLECLGAALARSPRGVAVLFLDVDRFKWLNDSLGHVAGDELLVELARRLRATARPGDVVARFGGDEFLILCRDVDEAGAEALARRIAASLAAPVAVCGDELTVTVSIGIAHSPAGARALDDSAETMVRDADAAMYRAKERGRDRIEVFDLTTRRLAVARHETTTLLRRGVERDEFVVHLQPEIDLTTSSAIGVEALVRWEHPHRGLLQPSEFIGLAEDTGLIVPLGAAVLREACRVVGDWQRADPARSAMSVSVNLAARQLLAPNVVDVVQEALAASGLAAPLLCLEITESVLLEDGGACSRALGKLKDLGVRIAVDDFGTGFSSLTYLKRFPVDVLKIDRSFVEGLGRSREDRAIVASVIDLAHAFKLTTIAEGVETVEQLSELKALGCEQAQGYLWSRPLPAEEAHRWLARRSATQAATARPDAAGAEAAVRQERRPSRRVLLVDDDRPVRQLLRMILDDEDDFVVVDETEDGREAIALARHHRPDVILLDLAMPGMGGLEALPLLMAVAPNAKIVVLSGLEASDHAAAVQRQGAAAFLTKQPDPSDLGDVLRDLLSDPRPPVYVGAA